jgi:hypothetical protein
MMNKLLPYRDESANAIYDLLFCDSIEVFQKTVQSPRAYPWDILLDDSPGESDLKKIINDHELESRIKLLAYHILSTQGKKQADNILLGVVVELGLEEGLDVLAAYRDGAARYINYTGHIMIWDTHTVESMAITQQLFASSEKIVSQIGPWNKPRRVFPGKGDLRISFLVSDGLYFGEGPINTLFKDPLAAPALTAATSMLQYITAKAK